MTSGPKFIRFFWPVIESLRELGGSAKPREIVDLVTEKLEIGDDERAERTKSGSLRVDNQVHWAHAASDQRVPRRIGPIRPWDLHDDKRLHAAS